MQKVKFNILGNSNSLTANVRNPAETTVGAIAAKAAARLGVSGTCEILDRRDGQVIQPKVPLSEVTSEELVLAPDLTPA